jgi:DNA-binding NarL/FixJ family response regulator
VTRIGDRSHGDIDASRTIRLLAAAIRAYLLTGTTTAERWPNIGGSAPYSVMAQHETAKDSIVLKEPEKQDLQVVLADDDVLLRSGLASLLDRPGFSVVGEAGDADTLLGLVRTLNPDLVIVDIRMPPNQTVEGLEAALTIREELPDVAILVLSAHVEVEHAMTLLAGGRGIGYLLKTRVVDVEDFIDSVGRVAQGGSVVDPALVQELVASRRRNDPLSALSAREREVLGLMAEGRSNLGIAQALWVAEGTVEKHVRSILGKLDLPDVATDHRRVLAVVKFLESR